MKYEVRLQMVQYAAEHGVKPAARKFGCQPRIARKWLARWRASNHARHSLLDRPRAPKTCPHKTPPAVEAQIVRERKRAPCLGAGRLKEFCRIPASTGAIARVLRQNGLAQRRKKKYHKKRDMRALKASWKPFERPQIDTKYLNDIPYYVEQMWRNPALPRFQYTFRDPKTGGVFLGFATELSEAHACCFVAALGAHLKRHGFDPRQGAIFQTDNGSEFSGAERKRKNDRGFTHTVENLLGARHRFIPPGKKNHQADVETMHNMIEEELFNLEWFCDPDNFFDKSTWWQAWANTTRKNRYKGGRTPDEILLEACPNRDPGIWNLPALNLDALLQQHINNICNNPKSKGHHVPVAPVNGPACSRS
jgi:hypothetical protein